MVEEHKPYTCRAEEACDARLIFMTVRKGTLSLSFNKGNYGIGNYGMT
jgi:hypothetical protein